MHYDQNHKSLTSLEKIVFCSFYRSSYYIITFILLSLCDIRVTTNLQHYPVFHSEFTISFFSLLVSFFSPLHEYGSLIRKYEGISRFLLASSAKVF